MPKGKPYTGTRDSEAGGNTMKPKGGHCTIEDLAGHAPTSGDAMPSLSPISSNPVVNSSQPRQDGDRVPYGD